MIVKDRIQKIKALKKAIADFESEILNALKVDLGKPEVEVILQELYPIKKEIDYTLRNIHDWTAKRRASTPLALSGTRQYVLAEPKGRVLIISPWNFPIMLTLRPLVSALAAGNTVVLKPSEHTKESSMVIKKLIESAFDKSEVEVVLGGPEVAADLTRQPFDHISFTGGTEIGKLVMRSAAEQLCSITLELGGKSPVIVDSTARIKRSAKRIAWGKYLNAGQVCIAPDYMLIEENSHNEMVLELEKSIITMFSEKPLESEDLGKIVNEKHYKRILDLIEEAVSKGAQLLVPGGELKGKEGERKIAPCFLTNCTMDMAIMREEIFGPVLPILTWKTRNDAVKIVEMNNNPLALYIFSKKRKNIDWFIQNTKAGTSAINEVIIQIANPEIGFGGIGSSGIGRSNGKASFDTYSNLKLELDSTNMYNALQLTFPPYSKFSLALTRFINKWL